MDTNTNALLHTLSFEQGTSAKSVAMKLGCTPRTASRHLDAIEDGLIESSRIGGGPWLFFLTKKGAKRIDIDTTPPKPALATKPAAKKKAKKKAPAAAKVTPAPAAPTDLEDPRVRFAAALKVCIAAAAKAGHKVSADIVREHEDRLVAAVPGRRGRRRAENGLTPVACQILESLRIEPQSASELIAGGIASNRRCRVLLGELEHAELVHRHSSEGRRVIFALTTAGMKVAKTAAA